MRMRITRFVVVFAAFFAFNISAQNCDWTPQAGSVALTCGNVVIGTTSPAAFFHVAGGTGKFAIFERNSKQLFVNANWADSNLFSQIANHNTSNMGLSLSSKDTSPEFLFVATSGKVGVGTTGPEQPLTVVGAPSLNGNAREVLSLFDSSTTAQGVGGGVSFGGRYNSAGDYAQEFASIQGVKENGTSGNYAGRLVFNTREHNSNPAERMRISGNGNVAVGGTDTVLRFSISGAPFVNGNAREVLGVYDTSTMAAGVGGGIVFGGAFNTAGQIAQEFASLQGVKENATDGNYAGALVFNTRLHNATPTERMRIESAGNVGIGTNDPVEKLHVAGNGRFDGTVTGTNIQAQYQDVAEWVPSKTDLAPGTVVVLDHDLGVTASTAPYDTTVAGVVSAQPGLILGEASKEKEMIATTGRVRVRVDARSAPIAVGDLLVTSSQPGMAMKSEPLEIAGRKFHQPGTIIGKALEPLAGGQGEILVLLSLQ